MTLHVTPRGDLIEHETSEACACLPQTLPTEGGFVVVHHAWDGRAE